MHYNAVLVRRGQGSRHLLFARQRKLQGQDQVRSRAECLHAHDQLGLYKDKALASIYRARGSWKQKKGELDASLADYGISIGIEPDNVESYDYRADVYQQNGDLDHALADYDHASRLDPTYAAAYYSRGLIYEKKNDIGKARVEYYKAIAVPTINRIAQWAQDNARARLKALAEEGKK